MLFYCRELYQNVRIGNKPELQNFADYLIDMGNGVLPVNEETNRVQLYPNTVFPLDLSNMHFRRLSLFDLIDLIFPKLMDRGTNIDSEYIYWVSERAILCPKNAEVDLMNEFIMDMFPGDPFELESADVIQDQGSALEFPVEFLNTLTPSSLPPHILILKVHVHYTLIGEMECTTNKNSKRVLKYIFPCALMRTNFNVNVVIRDQM